MARSITVIWGVPDGRGPMGQVDGGGRKLVRLDRGAERRVAPRLLPGPHTVQRCEVAQDTAPNDSGRGVLFVIPVEAPMTKEKWQAEKLATLQATVDAKFADSWREAARSHLLLDGVVQSGVWCLPSAHLVKSFSTFPSLLSSAQLRVVGGEAGAWSEEGKLLLALPELGSGEVLKQRLVDAWRPRHSLARARELAVRLELTIEFEGYAVREATDNRGLHVTWRGLLGGLPKEEIVRRDYIFPTKHDDPEGEVPEVLEACDAWAARVLQDASPEARCGILTTDSWVSATFEYVSPDERGTRIGGGHRFVRILVGGSEVASIHAPLWGKAQKVFGLTPGEECTLSTRQVRAFSLAEKGFNDGPVSEMCRKALFAHAGIVREG